MNSCRTLLTLTGPTSNPALSNKIIRALRTSSLLSRQNLRLNEALQHPSELISRPPSPSALINEKSGRYSRVERLNIFALPSMHIVSKLVDQFFCGTGILFPYIHKKSIYDGIAEMSSNGFRGIRRSWLCLLNAIMAFATVVTPLQDHQIQGSINSEVYLQRALKLLPPVWLQPANIEIR